jgi:hypothetical protein
MYMCVELGRYLNVCECTSVHPQWDTVYEAYY